MFGHFAICPSSSGFGLLDFFSIRFVFLHFRIFPSCIFGILRMFLSSSRFASFSIISGCFVGLTFSDVPVLFSIRFTLHHFRMFRLSCSDFPGVVRLLPDSLGILSCPDFSVFFPSWPAARSLIQGPFLQRLRPNSMCCWELQSLLNELSPASKHGLHSLQQTLACCSGSSYG